MNSSQEPIIIQGGMGVGVSGWKLAHAVSLAGQLGVVSGTALDVVQARRLQLGDHGGHIRRALAEFPFPNVAERILRRYFIPGGKRPDEPFRPVPMMSLNPSPRHTELIVAASFIEVHLAAEGHAGQVGINYLEKIQLPTLASMYGALLAGVDYVLMGAGIPRTIPGSLDQLSRGEPAELTIQVESEPSDQRVVTRFDPQTFGNGPPVAMKRPKFLAIVASATLASMLARKANGRVDGFVVEGPTAGGHNAPPRGAPVYNGRGEPVYGERDEVDLAGLRALERPFWLAGSHGTPEALPVALQQGATGVQVGTVFAFCSESGMSEEIKQRVRQMSLRDEADVITDPAASPTGFPFKVLQLEHSLSEPAVYEARQRICDLGFLRKAYRRADGTLGWRCPGEPIEDYVRKGGDINDTVGRKCICNALMANVELGQVRSNGEQELPLVTCGNDLSGVAHLTRMKNGAAYQARDVIEYLMSAVNRKIPARSASE